jgi:hypothetical protein
MNVLKHEGKLSTKNKALVLVCLTITLLGIALVPIYFPALRNELSDILFIAMVICIYRTMVPPHSDLW